MQDAFAELVDEAVESRVRRAAALRIGQMRKDITAAEVAQLVEQLGNPHNCEVGGGAISIRRAALLAFTELACGPDGVLAVVASCASQLTEMLRRADPDVREMAARAMAVLGAHAEAASLIARLIDEEEDVRRAASDALVSLRETLEAPDLDAILLQLEQDDAEVRVLVLQTLGGIGPLASAHADAIAQCLADGEAATRAAAARALCALGQERAVAHLDAIEFLLEDGDASARTAAVEVLAELDARSHADTISELLGDRDRSVRSAAAAALKRWGLA
jgi:HEAT repeat protein